MKKMIRNSYNKHVAATSAVFIVVAVMTLASCMIMVVEGGGDGFFFFRGGGNNNNKEDETINRRKLISVNYQRQYVLASNQDIANFHSNNHNSQQQHSTADVGDFEEDFGGVTGGGDSGVGKTTNDDGLSSCSNSDNQLYVLLNIKADGKFHDDGSYKLQDDDDDDDDSTSGSKYWDEDDLPEDEVTTNSICLDRDGCYEFILYGENEAFDDDDDDDDDDSAITEKDGYALLWVDVGVGLKKTMEVDYTFDRERAVFGCGCDDETSGCPDSGD